MKLNLHRPFILRRAAVIMLISVLSISGCSEYWWTRGQATPPRALLDRAQDRLANAQIQYGERRPDVSAIAYDFVASIRLAADKFEGASPDTDVAKEVLAAYSAFETLDGKLSIGSRGAYGELCSQYRKVLEGFRDGGNPVSLDSFQTLAARSLFFLSRELTTPQPTEPMPVTPVP